MAAAETALARSGTTKIVENFMMMLDAGKKTTSEFVLSEMERR